MSRPVPISKEALLAVARGVFFSHGYRASTAEIARRAGMSESSLFKRYKTKEALFLAAMDMRCCEQEWQNRLSAVAGRADIRLTLLAYGRHLLRRFRLLMPRIMMVNASGFRLRTVCRSSQNLPPIQHAGMLAHYLRAESECGRLPMKSPELQAEFFVGGLLNFVLCTEVLGHPVHDRKAYISALVENLVKEQPRLPLRGSKRKQEVLCSRR